MGGKTTHPASRPPPAPSRLRLVHVRVLFPRESLACTPPRPAGSRSRPPSPPPRPPQPSRRSAGEKFAQVRQQKGQRRSPPRRPGPRDAPASLPPAEPGSHRSTEAARSRSSSSSESGGTAAASMLCRRSSCRSPRSVSGRLHARGAALGGEGGGEEGRCWTRPSSSTTTSHRGQGGGWDPPLAPAARGGAEGAPSRRSVPHAWVHLAGAEVRFQGFRLCFFLVRSGAVTPKPSGKVGEGGSLRVQKATFLW